MPLERMKRPGPRAKITLHVDPASASKEHIAIFMTAASYAYTAGLSIPGVVFPIHVGIDFGGTKVCGTIERAGTEETQDVLERGECSGD
jgi:hypothetical protein